MTVTEVLDGIERRKDLRMVSIPDVEVMLAALRAVLDLHPERTCRYCPLPICGRCGTHFPCPEVHAISKWLRIHHGNERHAR